MTLGTLTRDALRRSLVAAMQAGARGGTTRADVDRLLTYAVDQIEHAMILDGLRADQLALDPH
jgi:hypothetical protein